MRGVSNLARQSNAPIPPDNLKRKLPVARANRDKKLLYIGIAGDTCVKSHNLPSTYPDI